MIRYPKSPDKKRQGVLNEAGLPVHQVPNKFNNHVNTSDYLDLHHALQKAYRLLSMRAHSSYEIEKKLQEKGFPPAVIKEALEKLQELKYLNDASFSSRWAHNLAINKLWGNRKIIANLREKGVAPYLIERAIKEVRDEISEEKAIALIIDKKMADERESGLRDIKERKRMFQRLLGRGFSAALILNKLGKIPEENFHVEDGK
ncbi:MAG: regulatory protein RecX [Smithella sp.]